MAESGQNINESAGSQEGRTAEALLRLSERTVIQAEELAKEITEHARRQSEADAKELREQIKSEAGEEARRITEAAEQQLIKATDEAKEKARGIVAAADQQAATITNDAKAKVEAESAKLLEEARVEGQETVSQAQAKEQEILDDAQRNALAITQAAQIRAENIESNARLRAEFVIKQMDQIVLDGIRQAVMDTCSSILPALDSFGRQALESPSLQAGDADTAPGQELLEDPNYDQAETESSTSAQGTTKIETSRANKPTGRRSARPSART